MERVSTIQHQGKGIIFIDISHLMNSDEQIATFNRAQELICSQPPGSVLSLIDYTGIHYNMPAVEAQKAYSKAITPYMKASAVVGVTGMLLVVFRSVVKLTKRKIVVFETREAALDWLVSQ
jgi:hypothetical protein